MVAFVVAVAVALVYFCCAPCCSYLSSNKHHTHIENRRTVGPGVLYAVRFLFYTHCLCSVKNLSVLFFPERFVNLFFLNITLNYLHKCDLSDLKNTVFFLPFPLFVTCLDLSSFERSVTSTRLHGIISQKISIILQIRLPPFLPEGGGGSTW